MRRVSTPQHEPPAAEEVVSSKLTAPNAIVAAHVSAARDAFLRHDLDACAGAALDALAHAPDELLAGFYLGQARLRQGRLYEALQAFEAVQENDPFGFTVGWLDRVQVLLAEQRQEWADPEAYAAIELERVARAALRQGDWDEARRLASAALARDPSNLLAHHHLGRALLALGRLDEALAVYETARPFDGGLGLVDGWLRQALGGESTQPWAARTEPEQP